MLLGFFLGVCVFWAFILLLFGVLLLEFFRVSSLSFLNNGCLAWNCFDIVSTNPFQLFVVVCSVLIVIEKLDVIRRDVRMGSLRTTPFPKSQILLIFSTFLIQILNKISFFIVDLPKYFVPSFCVCTWWYVLSLSPYVPDDMFWLLFFIKICSFKIMNFIVWSCWIENVRSKDKVYKRTLLYKWLTLYIPHYRKLEISLTAFNFISPCLITAEQNRNKNPKKEVRLNIPQYSSFPSHHILITIFLHLNPILHALLKLNFISNIVT